MSSFLIRMEVGRELPQVHARVRRIGLADLLGLGGAKARNAAA
jgi:hypothetical protein